VLLAVSEEAETWLSFFFFQCIIKQLLGSVFVIFRIIKVSSAVTSLSLRLQLITPTSTLIILDITKTASNNSRFPNEKHKKKMHVHDFKYDKLWNFFLPVQVHAET